MKVKDVRKIARKEKDPLDTIGRVLSVNDDGTFEVELRSGNTLNLVNSSPESISPGMTVDVTQRGKRGRKNIRGISNRVWIDPTIMYG